MYSQQFSSVLSSLLDKHARLKTISCSFKSCKTFITDDIITEKRKRSKLETIYRKTKTSTNKDNFLAQAHIVKKLITKSRSSYFRTLISNCCKQPKKLWSAFDALLSRKSPPCLPNCNSSSELASLFLNYFGDKIVMLCSKLENISSSHVSPHSLPNVPPPLLCSFVPATTDEVKAAIFSSSNASCSLDAIPTPLMKSCLDSLLLPITTLIIFLRLRVCFLII